ncbi:hypothetical protein NC652_031878 [Populus alba x Populus x berolinensis]|nr:hypothetical protein NC652_031878 [Populus alba x Populus x berolinensis]
MGSSVSPLAEMDESGSISPCEVAICLHCGIEFSGEIHPAALIKSLFEYKDKKHGCPALYMPVYRDKEELVSTF